METKKQWRTIRGWEVTFCVGVWVLLFTVFSSVYPDLQKGWVIMGIVWVFLIWKGYGTGIDYTKDELMVYRGGKCCHRCSWKDIQQIQIVSKRTGLLWRKHYALGFFGEQEQQKTCFLGVSPTVPFHRWKQEMERLQSIGKIPSKVWDGSRLGETEQVVMTEIIKRKNN